MKIIDLRALRGPNYYSRHSVILMKLDIEELENKPSDLVPGFKDNVVKIMPTLYEHTCSPGRIGGFYERLTRGTWAGHIVEHIAIELQCLAGYEVSFGKTFNTDKKGIYKVVFRYLEEDVGLRAAEMSVNIVRHLFEGKLTEIDPLVSELKEIGESVMLGPSTKSIVDEATRRGISHIRLNESSYIQLGQGKNQRRIQATIVDNTSAIGVEIADDKALTKSLLSSMGIPVAEGYPVQTIEEAISVANSIGYPVVVKPLVGNHGRGITTNITSERELQMALNKSKEICGSSIVEKYLVGFDYRILVINGKFVAATHREPAFVIGNGRDTIEGLINEINKDPERGYGHEKNLTRIKIDTMTEQVLSKQGLTIKSILGNREKIYIKSTANLSSGGIGIDVTDTVHHLNKLMAERISRIVDLNIMGIDIIAKSLEIPLQDQTCGILEVNAAPGFRMHLNPTKGTPRNVGGEVVDMLFPPGSKHSIPMVAVTGTNGKTTTARLISHILKTSGSKVGMASTDGITIDNVPILFGDYSGPEGAKKVIMDSSIDYAVLEVARGGILRRGLGYEESDVGVLLNISSDHLGEGGMHTLEELTRLKYTVVEAVKETGYVVLNADDFLVISRIDKIKASPILFSKDPNNKAIKANYDLGNINVIMENSIITIEKKGHRLPVENVCSIPITFDGKAAFNIENVLAAVASSFALGLDIKQIRKGLISFIPSMDYSRGRMNIIDMGEFKVVIDYGHNPGAINATGEFIKSLMPGKKIRMASSVGNRRDQDILEFGSALAKYYDHIVICDPDQRHREIGETADIVKEGLISGGFKNNMITIIIDERQATKAALEMAQLGDLVVLQVDNLDQVIKDVFEFKEKLKKFTVA